MTRLVAHTTNSTFGMTIQRRATTPTTTTTTRSSNPINSSPTPHSRKDAYLRRHVQRRQDLPWEGRLPGPRERRYQTLTSVQGKLYVRGDSKIFRFANGKTESLFLQRKNPRRIAWTVLFRRQHKKGISEVC